MSDHQVNVLAGIFMTLVLAWVATIILGWLYKGTQQIKNSGVGEKVKYSAKKAISKSSEGLSSAAKAGASLAKRVTKNDPSHRYDALIKLKQLLDSDAITVDEFEVEKRKLLDT